MFLGHFDESEEYFSCSSSLGFYLEMFLYERSRITFINFRKRIELLYDSNDFWDK